MFNLIVLKCLFFKFCYCPNKMASPNGDSSVWTLNDPLSVANPEIYGLIRKEKDRQRKGLEMIASENFTSLAVIDCLGFFVLKFNLSFLLYLVSLLYFQPIIQFLRLLL